MPAKDLLDVSDDELTFTINDKFAKRYEEKKKNEELTFLREKYGDVNVDDSKIERLADKIHKYGSRAAFEGIDEDEDFSDSEVEDEVGELVTPEVDAQIMKTIALIRKNDPKVYDSNVNFFAEEEMEKVRQEWKAKSAKLKAEKKSSMTLKDYHRNILLENGGLVDDEEGNGKKRRENKPMTFVEEQEKLKQDLKNALTGAVDDGDDEEDDGNLFSLKTKSREELIKEEDDYKKFLMESMSAIDGKASLAALQDFKEYQNNVAKDPNEAFLMNFILNRGWMEKPNDNRPFAMDTAFESEDEEAVDEMEEYERRHNFRYEEEGSSHIVTHARDIPGSLRRKDTKRSEIRQRRTERKEDERQQKIEELKRLKNLKKQEIWDKLHQIKEMTGNEKIGFDEVDLDKDFDPKEWDSKMSSAYNDDYYKEEFGDEDEDGQDLVKPTWNDDIDISDLVPQEEEGEEEEDSGNGKKSKKKNKKKDKKGPRTAAALLGTQVDDDECYAPIGEDEDGNYQAEEAYAPIGDGEEGYDNYDNYYDGEGETAPGKRKLSRKEQKKLEKEMRQKVKNFDDYLNEYYQLDYEDMVGDLPTRFKYQQVAATDYGLSPVEILLADDKDLNEFISLKKLAPYRAHDKVKKDNAFFKKQKKKKVQELRKKVEKTMHELEGEEKQKNSGYNNQSFEKRDKKKHKKQDKGEEKKRKRDEDGKESKESNTEEPEKKKSKKAKKNDDSAKLSTDRLASYGLAVEEKDKSDKKKKKKKNKDKSVDA